MGIASREIFLSLMRDTLTGASAAARDSVRRLFPAKNPAMWTALAVFRFIPPPGPGTSLRDATYSRSTMLRVTLLLAGFFVGRGPRHRREGGNHHRRQRPRIAGRAVACRWLQRVAQIQKRRTVARTGLSPGAAFPAKLGKTAATPAVPRMTDVHSSATPDTEWSAGLAAGRPRALPGRGFAGRVPDGGADVAARRQERAAHNFVGQGTVK